GELTVDVTVAVALVTAPASAAAALLSARDGVIGANDVDQVEEVAADRTSEDPEDPVWIHVGLRWVEEGHRAGGDAVEPVRKRSDSRVEAHVRDRDVDRDRSEMPEHEGAGPGRRDLRRPG